MSLITTAAARAQINTDLSDAELQTVIDREEAEVVRLAGAHYTGSTQTITQTLPGGYRGLLLPRAVTAVTTVTEALSPGDTASALTANTDYYLWPDHGRIERLPRGMVWGAVVAVTYKPADDTKARESVILELVRLALERTALRSESIAGEYAYTADDWEARRQELLNRLATNF